MFEKIRYMFKCHSLVVDAPREKFVAERIPTDDADMTRDLRCMKTEVNVLLSAKVIADESGDPSKRQRRQ